MYTKQYMLLAATITLSANLFLSLPVSASGPFVPADFSENPFTSPVNTPGFTRSILVDLDGDNDLDVISQDLNGNNTWYFRYFENTGDASARMLYIARAGADNPFDAFHFSRDTDRDTYIAPGDLDGDGDMLIGVQSEDSASREARLRYLKNIGDATRPVFEEQTDYFPISAMTTSFSTGPYENNADISETLTLPGTTNLHVVVAGQTEAHDDVLEILDASGNSVASFSGFTQESLSLPGSSLTIRFTSDNRHTSSGVTLLVPKR